jgi:cytochrome c-type biogenesis protein CcmF
LAFAQSVIPLVGASRGDVLWINAAKPIAIGHFIFILISFIVLGIAFATNDFSVAYVANNSNSQLPMIYKLCAIWGAHEGSLLLWALILSIWMLSVALFSKQIPKDIVARVLSVMGMISVGFLLFMLVTSNPFLRYLPQSPLEGRDLNPLLQDPGLIIHPPMLYMGYVGFSVVFAFAIASLIGGQLDTAWARWARPWTNLAWAFLTVGIVLGSWWAYYELGWGGWWFWDPVENASFMPWLVGTALIHSLSVTEKRGLFKAWTILLAIFAFSLSLLGTFLVRSGVLTSVHAFASDPERGVFILAFLVAVIGSSLVLFAWRAPSIKSYAVFSAFSRETMLLLNNIFFVVAATTILLGTLFPLIIDVLGLGKMSVGPPYFNLLFVPLMGVTAILLSIGINTAFKKTEPRKVWNRLNKIALISLLLGLSFPFLYANVFNWKSALAVMLVCWIVLAALVDIYRRKSNNGALSARFIGMHVAHIGFALTIAGVCLTSQYSEEKDVRLAPEEKVTIGAYSFLFKEAVNFQGPNYQATKVIINILKHGEYYDTLEPEKRFYPVQQMPLTETAINASLFRDLYVALGEPLDNNAWAIRVHYKPFVRFMWLGGLLIALGSLIALIDRRIDQKRVSDEA